MEFYPVGRICPLHPSAEVDLYAPAYGSVTDYQIWCDECLLEAGVRASRTKRHAANFTGTVR